MKNKISVMYFVCAGLSVIALITAMMSHFVAGYEMGSFPIIAISLVLTALLAVGCGVLVPKKGEHGILVAVLSAIILALLIVVFTNLILERAVLATAQFTYDRPNTVGWSVLIRGIVSAVVVFANMIVLTVCGFSNRKKVA